MKVLKSILMWLLGFFADKPLTKSDILAVQDNQIKVLDVPEWGGKVHLRSLGVEQRMDFLVDIGKMQDIAKNDALAASQYYLQVQCGLLIGSIVDSTGARCFTKEDIAALSQKSPAVISKIYDEIVRLNSFAVDSQEEEAKN